MSKRYLRKSDDLMREAVACAPNLDPFEWSYQNPLTSRKVVHSSNSLPIRTRDASGEIYGKRPQPVIITDLLPGKSTSVSRFHAPANVTQESSAG